MSPELLTDLLREEAEQAPHIAVPADTWRNGRRRRTAKTMAVALAVGAVVLGLVAVSSMLVVHQPVGPAGASREVGLPNHLYAPPERMSEQDEFGSWARDEVTSDLSVGPAAAAWVTTNGLPVLVDASTGEYHLLDLPDAMSTSNVARSLAGDGWQPLALSPDGSRLAYATVNNGRFARTGVTVIDLETGREVWSVPLTGSGGIVITDLSWSRSGEYLGWQGLQVLEWPPSSDETRDAPLPVVGVIGAAGSGPTIGVGGDGALVTSDEGVAYVVEPGQIRAARYCEDFVAAAPCVGPSYRWSYRPRFGLKPEAALSPDGSLVALSADGYDLVTLSLNAAQVAVGPPPIRMSATLGAEGAPDDRPWTTTSLGWVDANNVLVLRDPGDGSASSLWLVPADAENAPSVEVGVVDSAVGTPSIAIDLVTYDRPTVDRPAPTWPWSSQRWFLTAAAGAGALALLLLIAGAVLLRRRHEPGRGQSASDR